MAIKNEFRRNRARNSEATQAQCAERGEPEPGERQLETMIKKIDAGAAIVTNVRQMSAFERVDAVTWNDAKLRITTDLGDGQATAAGERDGREPVMTPEVRAGIKKVRWMAVRMENARRWSDEWVAQRKFAMVKTVFNTWWTQVKDGETARAQKQWNARMTKQAREWRKARTIRCMMRAWKNQALMKAGTEVRIDGINNPEAAELNGCIATVEYYEKRTQRYGVRMRSGEYRASPSSPLPSTPSPGYRGLTSRIPGYWGSI